MSRAGNTEKFTSDIDGQIVWFARRIWPAENRSGQSISEPYMNKLKIPNYLRNITNLERYRITKI